MVDCSKCRLKCSENFPQELRVRLCQAYWKLSLTRQRDFLLGNITVQEIKTRRPRKENAKQRNNSNKYFFDKNGVKKEVCQNFFCKTLSISNSPILHACGNKGDGGEYDRQKDKTGKHRPGNKTPEAVIKTVKEHIESFPAVESHYTRKSSKRQYLDPSLDIIKMHELFVQMCKDKNLPTVSSITYRRIFCQNYNKSFFVPKKDQCMTCSEYTNASLAEKQDLEENFRSHLERKEASQLEKNKDKQKANTDPSFLSITCDMEKVLQLPTSQRSLLYYLRKLNLYIFTIYEAPVPNDAYCYFWTEVSGKRGSCEIGSCLFLYIKNLRENVKHLTVFSDTCGGENRNVQISAFLLYTVKNHPTLGVIEQKFMESDHSYMDVDSMHSAIEEAKQNLEIFSIHEYENVFKMKLVLQTVFNKKIDKEGKSVNWLEVKAFKYDKQYPNSIFYKYNFIDGYTEIDVNFVKRSCRKNKETDIQIAQQYSKRLPISKAKKKELLKLCDKNIIPHQLQKWYQDLPCAENVVDSTAEPGVEDSDVEEDD
ncbi:unnamed protein product [Ceutorhynchus assimilis]|uniref:Uncharacterized protein n=1 Tax=Ceutorhynchus assimilis TaxID=467358 RepID=A0A9N9MYL1_9CUCU|nr:unnamed protein product [Ceutorhynchus assimilis]